MNRPTALLMALLTLPAATSVAGKDPQPPPLAGFETLASRPVKDHPIRTSPGTPAGREGGESVYNPLHVQALPFFDNGFTCDNLDDHDEACPYPGSNSPDVVYAYFPFENHLLDIDLCGSGYDTKVYVYENSYTPGNPYACNDDYYGSGNPCGAFVSKISGLPVTAGVPYFIVIDGYGGDCGPYQLRLDYGTPQPRFDVSFSQLTFGYEGFEDVAHSNIARVRFDFEAPPQMGFLNMAAYVPDVSQTAEWIVRNLIIPSDTMGPLVQMLAARFPMNGMTIPNGLPVSQMIYGYTITPEPLNDADVPTWYAGLVFDGAPVQQERVETHGYNEPGNPSAIDTSELSWWRPSLPPLDIRVNSWIDCAMPNVPLDSTLTPLDWNGCASAACANSLKWLEDKHDEIEFPPDLRAVYTQLSNLMNRLARQGAGPEQILTAKLDFIEAYGLPIHVKYQSNSVEGNHPSSTGESSATDSDGGAGDFPTRTWIDSESAAGEDVEIGVGFYYFDAAGELKRDGGHAVVVTGTGSVNGVPKIVYKHDTHQEDGTGLEQESSDVDEIGGPGGIVHLPGLDGWIRPAPGAAPVPTIAIVESVFSESYDASVGPVSGTHSFSGYCQWVMRTIPPGKKLKITYPNDPHRCFNSTIWRLDRTVKPPKWIKVQVWNFNSGQIREWVNNYDYPVTVAVHNDDHYESGGTYVPYSVALACVDAAGGDTSSASNESAYGGFSLGGNDGSALEFGGTTIGSVTVDGSLGVQLCDVPARLTDSPTGTQSLTLTHPIPVWNPYWENLGVEIHIAALASPGRLTIDCPSTGDHIVREVIDVEIIALSLTSLPPVSGFELTLTASNGLDVTFDSIGIPSLTPIATAVAPQDLPRLLTLEAAHPNPFNPATTIRFGLPHASAVRLAVYDAAGKLVAELVNGDLPAGRHEAVWLGNDQAGRAVATGVYVYRLEAGGQMLSGKMTLLK